MQQVQFSLGQNYQAHFTFVCIICEQTGINISPGATDISRRELLDVRKAILRATHNTNSMYETRVNVFVKCLANERNKSFTRRQVFSSIHFHLF